MYSTQYLTQPSQVFLQSTYRLEQIFWSNFLNAVIASCSGSNTAFANTHKTYLSRSLVLNNFNRSLILNDYFLLTRRRDRGARWLWLNESSSSGACLAAAFAPPTTLRRERRTRWLWLNESSSSSLTDDTSLA